MASGDRQRSQWAPGPETLSPARHFDTWDVDHPTALVHLPSGLRVHVCAFSDRAGAFTRFPAGEGMRLGPRTLDGSTVNLVVAHEGTELGLRFEQTDPQAARVRWWTARKGEWGLRFWVAIAVELAPLTPLAPPGDTPSRVQWESSELDPDKLIGRWRPDESGPGEARRPGGSACLLGARPPLLVTFHADLAALEREYETQGYWYLESRGAAGPVAALRYNLEEMPEHCLAIGVAPGEAGAAPAIERARSALAPALSSEPRSPRAPRDEPPASGWPAAPPPLHTGRYDGALDAVRDVIGWNTVHDPVNRRPYTALSRNWSSRKFGGFGIWLDDVLYHAFLAGHLDLRIAEENLGAVLAGRTEAGNLPCLLTGRDAWVDRSQPPIGAFVLWLLYLRWGERRLLAGAYETLRDNHEWWWRERDGNRNGLLEYGTSPVGDGLYRGTALGARNESSMDNSPVHDEARLVPASDARASRTLDCEDVGLNSLLVLDGEMLALAAAALGRDDEARRLKARARALATRIGDALWDPEREVFANRLWSGRFVASIAPTSFYPLIAGAASPSQARALLAWIEDPRRFGGRFALPSVSRDDPASGDNVYWRGRIWPPLNFLVYHGLRRYGFAAEAAALARAGYEMFAGPWREARQCAENYGAEDGAVTDQPDTDTFYGWGALMPALGVAEVCDVTPWDGWSIVHTGEDVAMGPVRSPPGWARCEARAGVLTVHVNGRPRLRTNARGRLRHLRLDRDSVAMELPPSPASRERRWLELPGIPAQGAKATCLDDAAGEPLTVEPGSDGARLRLPRRSSPTRITLRSGSGEACAREWSTDHD